jgi:lipoprotein NlpD
VLVGALAIALAGCASSRWGAPTETRVDGVDGQAITGSSYRVQAGDTLRKIASRANLDHRQIAAWNQLSSPDRIFVGQVLKLTPPGEGGARSSNRATGADSGRAVDRPAATAATGALRPAVTKPRHATPAPADNLRWQWPTSGRVLERFSGGDSARKGIKIGGKSGQAIVAAEGGEVVYSGSGLVGYGPLIIIKHNNDYLSAYGHNRKLLVQQGDQVAKGSRIAEMGLAGGSPLLHFEIRRGGNPVDPLALLPRRQ